MKINKYSSGRPKGCFVVFDEIEYFQGKSGNLPELKDALIEECRNQKIDFLLVNLNNKKPSANYVFLHNSV